MNKPIDVGLICMRNEAEDIVGWAKESLFFCKKVVAIIDPKTKDDTEDILLDRFPSIIIEYQDRSLGDSDNDTQGPKKEMICHANYTKGLQRHLNDGQWTMEMAPDERLVPSQFHEILEDLAMCKRDGYDGLFFPNYYTPIGDLNHVIDWYEYFLWGALKQIKFWRYNHGYMKNKPPHSNQVNWVFNPIDTDASFYHFCYVKNTRIPFEGWRDIKKYKDFKQREHDNPFPDWREMPELTDQGELIE